MLRSMAKCDFCGKEEDCDYLGSFLPKNWISARLYITNTDYVKKSDRDIDFHICTICYEPEHSQKDLKQVDGSFVNTASVGAKNILKKFLTYIKK